MEKDYIKECRLDICDGGMDCKTNAQPTKEQCQRCICAICTRCKCQQGLNPKE